MYLRIVEVGGMYMAWDALATLVTGILGFLLGYAVHRRERIAAYQASIFEAELSAYKELFEQSTICSHQAKLLCAWLLLPLQSHKPDDLESIRKQALKLIGSSVELRITAHKFAFVLPDQAWTAVAIALPNIAARMSRLTRKYLKMIEETDDDHEKEKLYDHLAILLHHSLITYHRFEQSLINWVREKKGLKALQQANEQVLSGLFHLSNSVSETSSAKLRQKDLVQRIRRISQVHLHQRSQQTSK